MDIRENKLNLNIKFISHVYMQLKHIVLKMRWIFVQLEISNTWSLQYKYALSKIVRMN